MSATAPLRERQSYRHEAFFWHGRADFLEGLVPFVVEGLDAGETVMVAVTPEHIGWISASLGRRAAEVHFVDMLELGRNPARIIPAWLDFLEASCAPGRPARGIGEPIWPGRSPEEVGEAQLHEALLNLAVDPDLPFWLLCPYDVELLDQELLDDAGRSHPVLSTATSYEGSRSYRGKDHARALFTADLPDLDETPVEAWVGASPLRAATEVVTLGATASDLFSDQVVALSDAVRELVVDGVHRGAERARVRVWDRRDELVCEVAERTVLDDFLVGRRPPPDPAHDPLWFANQAFDLVQVRSGAHGTAVRLHVHK